MLDDRKDITFNYPYFPEEKLHSGMHQLPWDQLTYTS